MQLTRTRRIAILSLFLLLGYGLRVYQLDAMSLWLDEGLTPLRSGYAIPKILSNTIDIQESISQDTHPPLYYLIIHATRQLWGTSDFAYRYPSVLFSLLSLAVLARFASSLTPQRIFPLIATLLLAFNPLDVWYAQEARMYSLLVLLMLLATHQLWYTVYGIRYTVYAPLLYVLFAGLALYTHYFAAFVIAGQMLIWSWWLWRRGQRKLIGVGIVLGFLVVIPLIPYTLPRLLTGAETRYSFVPLTTILYDVVRGFGLGVTSTLSGGMSVGVHLGMGVLLIIGMWRERNRQSVQLGVYLLAAPLAIGVLSLLKPMYLGVRHIIVGLPAFILLVAFAITYLRGRWVILAGMLVVSGLSLSNLYANPAVAKDDYRGLIAAMEQNVGENDVIVYNNAILLPLHEHYRQTDTPVTALPVYPYPFKSPDTSLRIEELVKNYRRIWLMRDPPPDGRDPLLEVRRILDQHLPVVAEYNFAGNNAELRTFVYDTQPLVMEQLPANVTVQSWHGGGLPPLAGHHLDFQEPARLNTLWLDLYWEASEADVDLQVGLRGVDGRMWVEQALPLAERRLPVAQVENEAWTMDDGRWLSSHGVRLEPATPPGVYDLLVRGWVDGAPVGEWHELTEVEVGVVRQPTPPEMTTLGGISFANGLQLSGLSIPDGVKPGHPLPLTLYWRSDVLLPVGLRYQLEVIAPSGEVYRTLEESVGPVWYQRDALPVATLVAQPIGVYFAPDAEVGSYRLRWRVLDGDVVVKGKEAWGVLAREWVRFGRIEVTPWPLITDLPSVDNPVEIVDSTFGGMIRLYSYHFDNLPVAGEDWLLTLTWQAVRVPDDSYKVFIHMVAVDSGDIVAQSDQIPAQLLRPTSGWREGEVIVDEHLVEISAEIPAGQYEIFVGLYHPETAIRLSILDTDGAILGDSQSITTIVLP